MKLPHVIKNSTIYAIINVLQKGIMFFLLPVYTAYLSPEDFGVISVVVSVSSFISIFILFSLNAAATRFYYKNKNPEYSKKLWGTITSVVIINSIVIGGLFILTHKFVLDPFLGNIDFYPYVFLGLLNTILSPLYLFFQTYLQTRQEGLKYGINAFSFFLLQVGLTVLFLILGYKAIGVLFANLITSLVFFVYVLIVFLPKIKIAIDKIILRDSLKYSLPLLPHDLASWSNGMIDKLFLNDIRSTEDAGLYGAGQQFGGIVGIVATSMNKAYVPWFFEQESKGEYGYRKIEKFAELMVLATSLVALVISLFSKEVLMIMVSEEYRLIWKFIPILCFGNVFHSLYYVFVNVLFLKNTNLVFIVTLVVAFINILLNIILIPILGIFGAAIAFAFSIFVSSIIALVFSLWKNKDIRFPWVKLYAIVFGFLIIASLTYFTNNFSLIIGIAIKAILVALLTILIGFLYQKQISIILIMTKNI